MALIVVGLLEKVLTFKSIKMINDHYCSYCKHTLFLGPNIPPGILEAYNEFRIIAWSLNARYWNWTNYINIQYQWLMLTTMAS